MNSIELYINKQLCDIENPADFSVYLKRQLLSPGELSKKDAQKSYDITLPATATNNAIFGYTNIEEVKGKFNSLFDATLIVNGIKIFDGKFRLSEITNTSYKGNLGVPAKEIKDIFGDKMMNEMGEWLIDFEFDEVDTINKLNSQSNPVCFFPFVLYGLLKKDLSVFGSSIPNLKNQDKTEWDKQVSLDISNLYPSVNCLQLIQQFFIKHGFQIGGTAFDNEPLKHLYVSYKNPKDKNQQWQIVDKSQHLSIFGSWSTDNCTANYIDERSYIPNQRALTAYIVHPHETKYHLETNKNFKQCINNDKNNYSFFKVPKTGTYHLHLDTTISLSEVNIQDLYNSQFEVQIRKSNNEQYPSGLSPQTIKINNISSIQGAYPSVLEMKDNKFRETNRISPSHDPNFICGFSFGTPPQEEYQFIPAVPNYYISANAMVINGAKPEDKKQKRTYVAAYYPGYVKGDDNLLYPDGKDKILLFYDGISAAYTHIYTGYDDRLTEIHKDPEDYIRGSLHILVCLEKGEDISINLIHDQFPKHKVNFNCEFNIDLDVFENTDWLTNQLDIEGNLVEENKSRIIPWPDEPHSDFPDRTLNMSDYLPSNVKIETWINDFLKAFNLSLNQISENRFELNIKNITNILPNKVINLDNKTDVNINRTNTLLGLPSTYEIKYKIKDDEQGYIETKEKASEIKIIDKVSNKSFSQILSFSPNWKKGIIKDNHKYMFPVITEKKIWVDPETQTDENRNVTFAKDYEAMQKELYTDHTQRFWFKDNETPFFNIKLRNFTREANTCFVTDTYNKDGQRLVLNYKDEPNSILNTYFTLLTDAENCYTTVECYLTPEEYSQIDSSMVKFNGDLYYVAEVDGYDPMCKRKATLKLVRKIQK